LNVVLDRTLSGLPEGLPPDRSLVGLFTNFVRLTDKALREYDAVRAELMSYVEPHVAWKVGPYLRAIDHMENCVSATHRASLNAKALRQRKVGRGGPRLTKLQEQRLGFARNAIEHSDEKILGIQKVKASPPFAAREPYSLRLANGAMTIGSCVLTYKELVSDLSKLYRTIEVIRGVPTGDPGPNFPNAKLRTDPGRTSLPAGSFRPSEYFKELARLTITH
jgi:hypothetical protein